MRAWHRNLVPDPHSSRTAHVLDCIGSRAIIIPRLTSCVMKATEFHSVTGAAEGINKGSSILPAAGALEAAEAVGGYQEGKVIPSVLLPGSKRSINSVLSKCKTSKYENTDKPLSSFINSFINFSKLYLPGQTHHPKRYWPAMQQTLLKCSHSAANCVIHSHREWKSSKNCQGCTTYCLFLLLFQLCSSQKSQ